MPNRPLNQGCLAIQRRVSMPSRRSCLKGFVYSSGFVASARALDDDVVSPLGPISSENGRDHRIIEILCIRNADQDSRVRTRVRRLINIRD